MIGPDLIDKRNVVTARIRKGSAVCCLEGWKGEDNFVYVETRVSVQRISVGKTAQKNDTDAYGRRQVIDEVGFAGFSRHGLG